MPDKASSDPSPNRHPIEIVTFCHLVGDDEIERERQRREEADRKRAAAPPLNPPPATIGALLAECEKQRGRIVAAMREGQARFYPGTDENFLAALKGEISGFAFKPLGLLFDAAVALDLGDVPALPGEPRTGRDAVALLETLVAWCRAKQGPASPASVELAAEHPAVKSKRPGGRKRLEAGTDNRDSLKANLYANICRNHTRGRRYADDAAFLKQDRNLVELAKRAGLPINATTVRNAIEWERQRYARNRRRSPNSGTNDADGIDN